MAIPLNSMVGREFVPNEDMGEWIVHLDAPEGTSLEGSTRSRVQAAEGDEGIEGVAAIEPSIGVSGGSGASTHIHLICQALPLDERKNTQAEMITEMRRRLAAFPGLPAEHHVAQRARQRRRHGRLRDFREHPRARSRTDRRILDAGARRGAEDAQPDRRQDQPQPVESRGARRRGSQARRRPRRPDGHGRQHAAAGGVGRRSDLVLQGGGRAVSGQDARARGTAARHRGNRPADGALGGRARCASTTSPRSGAALGPTTLARSNRQFTVMLIADVAQGHALDEAAERRAQDARRAARCRPRCRIGCRDSREFSTRRPRT